MRQTSDTLAIILGGGQGTRLFPLTATRSKPAVPIGGKYRLIDVPVSGCLHADIRRIFVLTQFNSASLNRHISNTYRLDRFSGGFVEILAAEQTPDNPNWYQGTADAVRQAARHFSAASGDYDLILAGDHLYRMDYADLIDAHKARAPTSPSRPSRSTPRPPRRWASSASTPTATSSRSRRSRRPRRLEEIGRSIPPGSTLRRAQRRAAVHGLDGRLRLLAASPARHAGARTGTRLRARADPRRARPLQGEAVPVSRLLGRRRNDRVVLRRQRHARPARCAVPLLGPRAADLHAPAASARLASDRLPRPRLASSPTAATSIAATWTTRSSASARASSAGAHITRSVLLGADFYEDGCRRPDAGARHRPRRRPRPRDRRQERAHRRRRAPGQRAAASSTPTATATTSAAASSSCRKAA